MIGVELQRLMTIVGGVLKPPQRKFRYGTLVPSLGKLHRFRDQLRCLANRFRVLIVLIQSAYPCQPLLLALIAIAPPKLTNAAIGQQSHATVIVVERPAQNGVVRIIAQETDRHYRSSPQHGLTANRQ